jgi:hypothetical protein
MVLGVEITTSFSRGFGDTAVQAQATRITRARVCGVSLPRGVLAVQAMLAGMQKRCSGSLQGAAVSGLAALLLEAVSVEPPGTRHFRRLVREQLTFALLRMKRTEDDIPGSPG